MKFWLDSPKTPNNSIQNELHQSKKNPLYIGIEIVIYVKTTIIEDTLAEGSIKHN